MFNCSTNCLCPIRSSQLTAALPFSMRTSSLTIPEVSALRIQTLAKNKILNIASQSTVSDKNMKCKQSENRVNKGENHTKTISSPPKRKEIMEISVSKQVLLSEVLKRRNCPSKNIKRKNILKNEQLRIGSGDHF